MKLLIGNDLEVIENASMWDVDMMENSPQSMYKQSTKMAKFCVEHKGVGLSACQISIPERYFVASNDGGDFFLSINPVYYADSNRYQLREICLSYPDSVYITKRYKTIRVEGYVVPGANTTIDINQLINRNAS